MICDLEGRYIMLYCSWENKKWLFVNVYAPNKDSPEFYQEVLEKVRKFSPDHCLIGGDFNLALDYRLDRMGTTTNNKNSAKVINSFMSNNNFIDIWREYHQDKPGYTWRKLGLQPKFSRLDYFLMFDSMFQMTDAVEVEPGF